MTIITTPDGRRVRLESFNEFIVRERGGSYVVIGIVWFPDHPSGEVVLARESTPMAASRKLDQITHSKAPAPVEKLERLRPAFDFDF